LGVGTFRWVLFCVCVTSGALAGPGFSSGPEARFLGGALGALVFAGALGLERVVRSASPVSVLGAGGGALAGLLGAVWLREAFGLSSYPAPLSAGLGAVAVYLGSFAGARGVRALRSSGGNVGVAGSSSPKVLDSSAIIDGRIVDMVELGFIGSPFVVPQFVLNEVQGIADSTDPLKRARGRRGLGILEKLQSLEGVEVRISDHDFPRIKEVDGKIVALSKASGATLVTNDFNLSKVAELQGVRVLNIHQLAHALRPVVLPGEEIQITLQKLGKEPGQGVGYMEDGTMVVVEGGAEHLGEPVQAVVTSVLQTSAGRMIFARPHGELEEFDAKPKRSVWRRRA
jgi:uncharacterized protein YacL